MGYVITAKFRLPQSRFSRSIPIHVTAGGCGMTLAMVHLRWTNMVAPSRCVLVVRETKKRWNGKTGAEESFCIEMAPAAAVVVAGRAAHTK